VARPGGGAEGWGVVLCRCGCVSVSGLLFSLGVCVYDLLTFLHLQERGSRYTWWRGRGGAPRAAHRSLSTRRIPSSESTMRRGSRIRPRPTARSASLSTRPPGLASPAGPFWEIGAARSRSTDLYIYIYIYIDRYLDGIYIELELDR